MNGTKLQNERHCSKEHGSGSFDGHELIVKVLPGNRMKTLKRKILRLSNLNLNDRLSVEPNPAQPQGKVFYHYHG